MSVERFLDRLEGELLEAARREQAPAWPLGRVRPGRWLRPLGAVAVVAALLAVVAVLGRPALEPAPQPAVEQALRGTWQAGPTTLTFESNGSWRADSDRVEAYGWTEWVGGTLVLHPSIDASEQRLPTRSAAERRRCDERPGSYGAVLRDGRLLLEPISEPCPARAAVLGGFEWERGG